MAMGNDDVVARREQSYESGVPRSVPIFHDTGWVVGVFPQQGACGKIRRHDGSFRARIRCIR